MYIVSKGYAYEGSDVIVVCEDMETAQEIVLSFAEEVSPPVNELKYLLYWVEPYRREYYKIEPCKVVTNSKGCPAKG